MPIIDPMLTTGSLVTETPIGFSPMVPVGQITWERTTSFKDSIQAVFFLRAIKNDITQLNQVIEGYNSTNKIQEKRILLDRISWQMRTIQDAYPGDIMTGFQDYKTEILHNLFVDLHNHTDRLNQLSPPIELIFRTEPTELDVSPAEMLERMSPAKVSALLSILSAGKRCDISLLDELYPPIDFDVDFSELVRFNVFLSLYKVAFLGGGNAQNFTAVLKSDPSQVFVLKVEERLNMPKRVERYLRETVLRDVLAPIYAERQATFMRAAKPPYYPEKETTCSLLITVFCPEGNLEAHAAPQQNPADRLRSALNLYTQMGDVLMRMQMQNCAFPDIKNTNWLVDGNDRLQLADTKSFIMTAPDGTINTDVLRQNGYGFITTGYMNPPEMYQSNTFSADKMHAYMLGKNVYQYVTNCSWEYLKTHPSQFDFTDPIFGSPEGGLLKTLIVAMTVDDPPAMRMPMSTALAELQQIKNLIDLKQMQSVSSQTQADTMNAPPTIEVTNPFKSAQAVLKEAPSPSIQPPLQPNITHRFKAEVKDRPAEESASDSQTYNPMHFNKK